MRGETVAAVEVVWSRLVPRAVLEGIVWGAVVGAAAAVGVGLAAAEPGPAPGDDTGSTVAVLPLALLGGYFGAALGAVAAALALGGLRLLLGRRTWSLRGAQVLAGCVVAGMSVLASGWLGASPWSARHPTDELLVTLAIPLVVGCLTAWRVGAALRRWTVASGP